MRSSFCTVGLILVTVDLTGRGGTKSQSDFPKSERSTEDGSLYE